MPRIMWTVLAFLAGLLTVPLSAQAAVADTGCPTASASYAGGAGTQASPWQISTASELQKLRDDSIAGWDDSFILTANINMSGCTWTKTIGDGSKAFTGMVDGSGFTVSGLTITPTSTDDTVYAGLVGRMSAPGVLTRVSFTGTVTGSRSSTQSPLVYAGGLVGNAEAGTLISYSTASGVVSASAQGTFFGWAANTDASAGGLVGALSGSLVSSYATGNASANVAFGTSQIARAGGLVGHTPDGVSATITYSYSTGTPNAYLPGGLIGVRGSSTTVTGSLWDVTSSTRQVGVSMGSETGVAGKTTAQMKQFSTYDDSAWPIVSGWQAFDANANKVWGICEGSTRAFLLWQYSTNPCASKPGAPTLTNVTPAGTSAVVNYTVDDTGGAALTRVEFAWDDTVAVDDSTSNVNGSFALSNLQAGTTYTLYVRAVNSQGDGPWSAPRVFTTLRRPGVPVITGVTPDVTTAEVSFTADDSGGAPVLRVEFALDDTTTVDDSTTNLGSPATLSGLASDTTYSVYARAVNSQGEGDWSAATSFTTLSLPVPPAPIPPSTPQGVSAVAGDASLRATWSPPASSGSFAVSSYQATASPGGRSCLASTTACTISKLTNGVAYTVTVKALSGAGWSDWSTPSSAVTPRSDAVPSITITGSRGSGAERSRVSITGVSTGHSGASVRFWISLAGGAPNESLVSATVADDGTFTWSRKARRQITVYAEADGLRSNAVHLPGMR